MSFESNEMIYQVYSTLSKKAIYLIVFISLICIAVFLLAAKYSKQFYNNRCTILGENYEAYENILIAEALETWQFIKQWWSIPMFNDFTPPTASRIERRTVDITRTF